MAKTRLTKDSQFTVREDRVLVYILAALFFGLFLYGMTDAILQQFKKTNYQSFIFMVAIVPALYCYKKAKRNRTYIRVNIKGIYQDEKLMTGWADLLKVSLAQDQKRIINIQDDFVLVVEFKKNNQGFRRKIPLTNTQNKSEEEVLAAVQFFWKEYRKATGV